MKVVIGSEGNKVTEEQRRVGGCGGGGGGEGVGLGGGSMHKA